MSVRRTLIAAGTAGLLTVGALGVVPAAAQDTGSASGEHADRPVAEWRRQHRQERRAALAAELGITVEDLVAAGHAAHQTVRDELGPVDPDNPPDEAAIEARRAAYHTALAAELGITEDDLRAAARSVLEARTQEAVGSGHLTEEEAVEILAAFDDGTLRELTRERRLERLTARLEQAVANGNMSQEQMDAILEQVQDGGFHRPGRGERRR